GYEDMEAQFAWDDQTIRRTFIRKVYAILLVQLLVTVGIVALFSFCSPVRFYIQTHPGLYMASYFMFFTTYIALSCCGELRRQFPWNIVLLILFTLSMAFMMGFVSSFYNTKSVLLCLGITALVCLSVTLFSFQSKVDVTSCQGVLFSLCMVLLLCAITISIVVPFGYVSSPLQPEIDVINDLNSSRISLVCVCAVTTGSLAPRHLRRPGGHPLHPGRSQTSATLSILLLAFVAHWLFPPQFLAFDTQMLLGNKRYAISPEEYIFATLSIYLDIVNLFSFLLQIVGGGRE
ncbi:unnamed protein product, partial [Tetraodon nigroviridis]